MLGEFTGQDEPDSSLDLSGGDRRPGIVLAQLGCLHRQSVEDVCDERVEDGHGAGGDTSVVVHLLQDFVDVRSVCLLALALHMMSITHKEERRYTPWTPERVAWFW